MFVPLTTAKAWSPLLPHVDTAPPPPPPDPPRPSAAEHAAATLDAERQALQAERAALATERARIQAQERATTEELGRLLAGVEALRAALVAELRAQAADVVVATAIHVAGEGLRVQPALLDALIAEAIDALGMHDLTLRVSPADEPRIREALGGRGIPVVADETLHAGCIAQAPTGRIDASLETAVAAVQACAAQWTQA